MITLRSPLHFQAVPLLSGAYVFALPFLISICSQAVCGHAISYSLLAPLYHTSTPSARIRWLHVRCLSTCLSRAALRAAGLLAAAGHLAGQPEEQACRGDARPLRARRAGGLLGARTRSRSPPLCPGGAVTHIAAAQSTPGARGWGHRAHADPLQIHGGCASAWQQRSMLQTRHLAEQSGSAKTGWPAHIHWRCAACTLARQRRCVQVGSKLATLYVCSMRMAALHMIRRFLETQGWLRSAHSAGCAGLLAANEPSECSGQCKARICVEHAKISLGLQHATLRRSRHSGTPSWRR